MLFTKSSEKRRNGTSGTAIEEAGLTRYRSYLYEEQRRNKGDFDGYCAASMGPTRIKASIAPIGNDAPSYRGY
jgi:hypothetical protein